MAKKKSRSGLKHKYQPVYLEWVDAVSPHDTWQALDGIKAWDENTASLAKEIGFLLYENKINIVIARGFLPSSGHESDIEMFAGVGRIPKISIVKMQKIKCG